MKTTTISHYTKSNTDDTAAGEDVERQELSFVAGGMQNEWYSNCGRQFGGFLEN